MNFRPICDHWILARTKLKYYGSFPEGFLERARILLGANLFDPVLHVCSGMVWKRTGKLKVGGIPLKGFGKNDVTLDIRPEVDPLILGDARNLSQVIASASLNFPTKLFHIMNGKMYGGKYFPIPLPRAILIDRPYSLEDAEKYGTEKEFPNLNDLVRDSLKLLPVGNKVGVLDYQTPSNQKQGKLVAHISVSTGFNSRQRIYSVFEKI